MKIVRHPKDFVAGLLFAAIGVDVLALKLQLPIWPQFD